MDLHPSTSPDHRPVALVTGTSSGMGLHAAVELARRGHTVVATMRDPSRDVALRKAAAEAGVELDVRPLDVTDHDAARACVDGILADHGHLDVLVNNAGRGAVATAEQLSLEEVRDQLEVNYLGPVALTKLVLPHMRAAGSGRVLTVTSVGGAVGQPFADAYCGAKFAVEGFMQSLAVVMLAHGVRVSVIEPAAVASDFVGNVARPDATNGDDPYAAQLDAYLARSAGAFANAQSSEDAARAIADAATAEDYRFRWQTSEAASAFVGLSLADTDGSRVLAATRPWIEAAK
ncbi:SDR family oxidoreductase [Terrabacter sp. NPDC080008]|uniref:SDR family oxidoreductase n=1 Tax=Terrabacter sp. NPDC080008 TaxID=3155176 RepID=UPI00344DE638